MKKMCVLVFMLMLAAMVPALAESHNEMTVEQKKENVISWVDRRIGLLQELKGCVQTAKTKEDIEKCREAFEAKGKADKEKMKERKQEGK